MRQHLDGQLLVAWLMIKSSSDPGSGKLGQLCKPMDIVICCRLLHANHTCGRLFANPYNRFGSHHTTRFRVQIREVCICTCVPMMRWNCPNTKACAICATTWRAAACVREAFCVQACRWHRFLSLRFDFALRTCSTDPYVAFAGRNQLRYQLMIVLPFYYDYTIWWSKSAQDSKGRGPTSEDSGPTIWFNLNWSMISHDVSM